MQRMTDEAAEEMFNAIDAERESGRIQRENWAKLTFWGKLKHYIRTGRWGMA